MDRVTAFVADDPESVHSRGPEGARPLHYAATAEIARFLIERGADLDAVDDYHGRTALNWHAQDPEVLDVLRASGARIDDIFTAALAGDLEAVKSFLEASPELLHASPPEKDMYSGGTILHLATVGGHDELVRYLVDRGADLQRKDRIYDATPKGWARYFKREETAALLETLEGGTDVNS